MLRLALTQAGPTYCCDARCEGGWLLVNHHAGARLCTLLQQESSSQQDKYLKPQLLQVTCCTLLSVALCFRWQPQQGTYNLRACNGVHERIAYHT